MLVVHVCPFPYTPHTRACTHTSVNTPLHSHKHTYTHIHTHAHTHTRTHTHAHTHTHTHTHTLTHTHTHTNTHTHVHTREASLLKEAEYISVKICAYISSYMNRCSMYVYTYTYILMYIHTQERRRCWKKQGVCAMAIPR